MSRARCVVAEAEIALAARDLGWPTRALDAACIDARPARRPAERQPRPPARDPPPSADRRARRGRAARWRRSIRQPLPAALRRPSHELIIAGIAIRRIRTKAAREALDRADKAARDARIPALTAEVENAARLLDAPAARLIARGEERPLRLDEVEALQASKALVVDACRNIVRDPRRDGLARRAGRCCSRSRACWPRHGRTMCRASVLVARAFGGKEADESHRARLRVEIGRLRAMLKKLADVRATERGFALAPRRPARSWCWRGRSRRSTRRCWRSWPTANPGRARRWRWRSAPASAPCSARSMRWPCRQGAVVRRRPRAPLDDAAGAGIHDDLVTPGAAAGLARVRRMKTDTRRNPPRIRTLHRRRRSVGGVSFDGQQRLVRLRATG